MTYVEGDTKTGAADSGRPPVKIAGVDGSGNVRVLLTDSAGALNPAGSPTSLGQKTMANSTSVAIASNQSAVPVTNQVTPAATATLSNVASSASSVTVLALNAARLGATIVNDSTQVLYLKFGATASATSYVIALAGSGTAPFAYYEVPFGYTGIITGIWASANGNARVLELTA